MIVDLLHRNDLLELKQEVESLEDKNWVEVGKVSQVGIYGLRSEVHLSKWKEIMVLLVYSGSVIGSMIAPMSSFNNYPITVNAPIDSTFKQRLVKLVKISDNSIQVDTFKNLTQIHIYVR